MGFLKKWAARPARSVKLIDIDFSKPWWSVFTAQKGKIIAITISILIFELLDTLQPIFIGWVLLSQSYLGVVILTVPYLVEEVISWFVIRPLITQLHAQTMDSFRYSACKTLLAIDPEFHTQQSSGVSLGKIRRTTDAYFRFIKKLLDDLVPLTIVLVVAMTSVFMFNTQLGIVIAAVLLALGGVFGYLFISSTRGVEAEVNKTDDRANHVGAEIITRIQFIRASFAVDQMDGQLEDSHLSAMRSSTTFFMTYRLLRGFLVFFFTLCIGCIVAFLIKLIGSGELTTVAALSIVMMILRSAHPLLKLDKYVTETVSAYRKIKDFYAYIQSYGKQTYPVFKDEHGSELSSQTCETDPISLTVEHVSASYAHGAPLLQDITLQLSVTRFERNKLYGIIGPSGIGKTTFISLLGGQLKPSVGHVLVNGCDIYQINDYQRQRLIALQGQIATNVYGSLKYNVTFGLPENHTYSDEDVIALLEAVGLWYLFRDKGGLGTMIGEGGLTLSGGQRQRLNFANLFLRAEVYKPSLILIDEPTSSLDEVSEQRITEMISQLAEKSLTLVIAHRLKTLEDAHKILDFCLINQTNRLVFYEPEELKKRSLYYQKLIQGQAILEE